MFLLLVRFEGGQGGLLSLHILGVLWSAGGFVDMFAIGGVRLIVDVVGVVVGTSCGVSLVVPRLRVLIGGVKADRKPGRPGPSEERQGGADWPKLVARCRICLDFELWPCLLGGHGLIVLSSFLHMHQIKPIMPYWVVVFRLGMVMFVLDKAM